MAQPDPVYVSPSTTVVQVDILQNPYTPVILNSVQYAGQVVTVLNSLSTVNIYETPIVVSTITNTAFTDGKISTLIDQPLGYVTMQTILPNKWALLNSFPFRDQFLSAGVQTLTTSSIYTALISTQTDITSSLIVENLIVSGNFNQNGGLTLNTDFSSVGAVYVMSSLTVIGDTYISSYVSSVGFVTFNSTLHVLGNLTTNSNLQFLSNVFVSTNLSAVGFLSTPWIQLEGGLEVRDIEIQTFNNTAVQLAGNLVAKGGVEVLSSVNAGGNLHLQDLYVLGNFSTLSTLSIYDNIRVNNTTLVQGNLYNTDKLALFSSFYIKDAFQIQENLYGGSNLHVFHTLQGLGTLETNSLEVLDGRVNGNVTIVSTVAISTQGLDIRGSFGFQNLYSISTSAGSVSTFRDLVFQNAAFLQSNLTVKGTVSTLRSMSVMQDLSVMDSISVGTSLTVTGGMTALSNVCVSETSFLNQSAQSSVMMQSDLNVANSVVVRGIAFLSSIALISSIVAFNFITSTMTAGYKGIADKVQISTLQTSSIATGGLTQAQYTMDMANVLQTYNMSSFLLSTNLMQVGNNPVPSTTFQVTSSFGLGKEPLNNTMDIRATAYTLNSTFVNEVLSTNRLNTPFIKGNFIGDGSLLSNANFPEQMSTFSFSTNQMIVDKTFISSFNVSSGIVTDVFVTYSTLQIGAFSIYGNADSKINNGSNCIYTVKNNKDFTGLNNMEIYGNTTLLTNQQVLVNSQSIPTLPNTNLLGVGGILKVNNLISPNFIYVNNSYVGDTVYAGNIGTVATDTLYVSSGIIGRDFGTFFIPEQQTPAQYSTNTIQPILSTMVFNSTLIVDRGSQRVGINKKPLVDLDVQYDTYVQDSVLATQWASIDKRVNFNPQVSSFWLGVCSNSVASNISYSYDGEIWNFFTPSNYYQSGTLLAVANDGGRASITSSNTLSGKTIWVSLGIPLAQYYLDGDSSWYTINNTSKFPQSNAAVAFNGFMWVVTGYNISNANPLTFPTLHWSDNGTTWYKALSGGFTWDGVSDNYGGHGLAWNGSLWIAVGKGASDLNSILYSGDGKNWSDAASGGFSQEGNGVVWSGSNWIATGNNGGPLSSFVVSDDGVNWTGIGGYGFNSGFANQRGNAIATDGNIVVAVGSYSSLWPATSIQYSLDKGYTWCNASGTLFDVDGEEGKTIVYNGQYWLAGGTNGIRKSYDGINWFQPGSAPTNVFAGLSFNSNAIPIMQLGASNYISTYTSTITTMNVACGKHVGVSLNSNCLRYSTDGKIWNESLSGWFTETAQAAAYDGSNLWVAAGQGIMSNFTYSGDAKNWSNGIFLDSIGGMGTGKSLTYGANYWIGTIDSLGGGGNVIWYSSDGISWRAASAGTQFTQGGQGVAFGNGKYMAVGYGGDTILYAQTLTPPDTWTNAGITNAFDLRGNGIAYGNSLWVAVGEDSGGKTIKYSGNQVTWNDAVGVFGTQGWGVDYDGSSLWVAVGDGGGFTSNILYSGDAINWSNANSGDFITSGYGVRYNQGLGLWLAAGYDALGVNTLKYSGDGSNWSNGTGGFDYYGFGLGVASNTVIQESISLNQLRFYNSPAYGVTSQGLTPNISYTSSSLSMMNTLTIDQYKNISLQSNITNSISSFYDHSLAVISTVVSTNVLQAGGFFLSFANV